MCWCLPPAPCARPLSTMRAQLLAHQVPACHLTREFQPSSVTRGMLCQAHYHLSSLEPWTTSAIKSVTPQQEVGVTLVSRAVLGLGLTRTGWNPSCLGLAQRPLWLSPRFPLPSPPRSRNAGLPRSEALHAPSSLWSSHQRSPTVTVPVCSEEVSFSSPRAQPQRCLPLCLTGQKARAGGIL